MNIGKWIIFASALMMIGGTALCLSAASHNHRLGAPGVRVGQRTLYDENGQIAAREAVLLPDEILGARASELPVTEIEVQSLPRDTTFGRALYRDGTDSIQVSVVLMGTDRTSIHDPHYCLTGQDWQIEKTEQVSIPMDRPFHYDLPVLKLSLTRLVHHGGQDTLVHGFYVYWFVSGDHLTANMGTRMWSEGMTMLKKHELERWAYISYLVACYPGQEDVTYKNLEQFIRASVPEFMTATPR